MEGCAPSEKPSLQFAFPIPFVAYATPFTIGLHHTMSEERKKVERSSAVYSKSSRMADGGRIREEMEEGPLGGR